MLLTHGPWAQADGSLGPSLGPGPRGARRGASGGLHNPAVVVLNPASTQHLWGPAQGMEAWAHGPRAHELEAYGLSSIRGFEATPLQHALILI